SSHCRRCPILPSSLLILLLSTSSPSSPRLYSPSFFFFNDPATTEIYTLSLHDALPIWFGLLVYPNFAGNRQLRSCHRGRCWKQRSEEHTSELQSLTNLVCRLLLEKKKKKI